MERELCLGQMGRNLKDISKEIRLMEEED